MLKEIGEINHQPHFKCSIATKWLLATILDREDFANYGDTDNT